MAPGLEREAVLPYAWMVCGSFSFAIMATLSHALKEDYDWQFIALSRAFLALVLAVLLGLGARIRFAVLQPRTLWVRSLSGSLSLVCGFYSLTHLPVSEALTLTHLFPVWVALLSWPLYKEVPSAQVWLSVASSVAGVVLIQQPHFGGANEPGTPLTPEPVWSEGSFAVFVAVFSSFWTAVAMLGLHRLRDLDPRAIVAHFSGVSTVFCLVAWLGFERTPLPLASYRWTTPLVLLGVGTSATIGQLFLTKAFAAGPPAKVAVVGLIQVVFAVVFEVMFERRAYNARTILGMLLILAPTAWLMLQGRAGSVEE